MTAPQAADPPRPPRQYGAPRSRRPLRLLDRVDDAALPVAGRVLARGADLASAGRRLPGVRVRRAGEPPTDRVVVDAALPLADGTAAPPTGVVAAPAVDATAATAATAATDAGGAAATVADGEADPPDSRASRLSSRTASVVGGTFRLLVLGLVVLIIVGAVSTMLRGPDPGNSSSGIPGPGPGGPPAGPATPITTVGPVAGDEAAEYAAAARAELESLAGAAPQADLYAVVSLAGYRTPEELHRLFATFRISEVFFRVPPDGGVLSAPVRDPVADVEAAFASAGDAAETRARDAGEGLGADTGTGTDTGTARAGPEDQPGASQQAANEQAAALRARCACLFGVVLRAPGARLLELARDGQVRVVDPAPPGLVPPAVRFVPLEPERP
ncbi:hypothetical protein [Parafrankia sp. FMc2]|uniref:hypothetical protein n=1 Tax=Parafrankia sp. FMc2 TaxID=3233196 RepID=UPI0034D5658B